MFLGVSLRPHENDKTLGSKNTNEQAIAGSQDGKDLHGDGVLSRRADEGGHEGHPHGAEDEHAESDQLGLVEVVGQFPGEEGQ